jgi:hypothetical protein
VCVCGGGGVCVCLVSVRLSVYVSVCLCVCLCVCVPETVRAHVSLSVRDQAAPVPGQHGGPRITSAHVPDITDALAASLSTHKPTAGSNEVR